MSKQKPSRWYEVVGDTAYIYDHPYPCDSLSVSIVPVRDLDYYRTRFDLTKIWTSTCNAIPTASMVERRHYTNEKSMNDNDIKLPPLPSLADREGPPAAHPAITHCDNCGCDWLDNGLNPIGCPYCKLSAEKHLREAREKAALEVGSYTGSDPRPNVQEKALPLSRRGINN